MAAIRQVKRLVISVPCGVAATGMIIAILSLSAGRWDLPFMWAYSIAYGLLTLVGMAGMDYDLLKERIRPGPGGSDHLLIHAAKVLFTCHMVLAGLDVGRYHWSDRIPGTVQALALALGILFGILAVHSMLINRFFSPVIRLQPERGQYVVTSGPYGFVRHPGYLGILMFALCSPIALGSFVAMVPEVVLALMIVRRTILEDTFLRENLDGYADYAARVRYCLVPGLW